MYSFGKYNLATISYKIIFNNLKLKLSKSTTIKLELNNKHFKL